MPDFWNRRDDTFEKRVGKWAFRQFVVLPIVVLVVIGIIALINAIRG